MQIDSAVSAEEAAEKLGVSVKMVHRYLREGRLPAKKFHRVWIIEREDLEEFAKKDRPRGNPNFLKSS